MFRAALVTAAAFAATAAAADPARKPPTTAAKWAMALASFRWIAHDGHCVPLQLRVAGRCHGIEEARFLSDAIRDDDPGPPAGTFFLSAFHYLTWDPGSIGIYNQLYSHVADLTRDQKRCGELARAQADAAAQGEPH